MSTFQLALYGSSYINADTSIPITNLPAPGYSGSRKYGYSGMIITAKAPSRPIIYLGTTSAFFSWIAPAT